MKTKKALYLVGGILLAAALIVGLYFGVQALKNKTAQHTPSSAADSTSAVNDATDTKPVDTGETPLVTSDAAAATEPLEYPEEMEAVKAKEVYTVDELQSDDPWLDLTVASCEDSSITNRQAQIYYLLQFYSFMREYGDYAEMFGLDPTKALSEQPSLAGDLTWEQYFLMAGMQQYQQYAAVYAEAEAQGYQITAEEAEKLSGLRDSMEKEATQYGYESVDAYIQASFGPGVRYADYEAYLKVYFKAMSYENHLYESISCTEQDLKDYLAAHPDEFEDSDTETPNINVRHILISSDADGDGETTEEERAAAQAKAEELLAGVRANLTEEYFAELAKENSDDPGSKNNGGLYEEVYPGQMVAAFNDWCFAKERKPGDVDVVETSYGFHVMYFVKQTDSYHWRAIAEDNLKSETMDKLLQDIISPAKLTVNYKDLILAPIPLGEEE